MDEKDLRHIKKFFTDLGTRPSEEIERLSKCPSNTVTDYGDFYISYNPSPKGGFSDETALCKNGEYYILNGDFRKDYEPLIPLGFQKCLEFYRKNKDKQSFWSSDYGTNS